MRKLYRPALALAAFASLALSCAKYESEDNLTAQKRIREAWMRTNLGQVIETDENGLYVLEKTQGSTAAIGDTAYIRLDYVCRDLDGNYTQYTTEEVARIMATYSDTAYFCPEIMQLGKYKLYSPVENFLRGLGKGGSARFLLPPEATTYAYTAELKKYYKSYGNDGTTPALSENYIYEVKVQDVIEDIYQYQKDQLEEFAAKKYNGLDSLSEGFYMLKLQQTGAEDTIAPSATVKVNYIGKLLDGFCFDTNIQDSAKVYGRYNVGQKYSSLSVTWQKDGYTVSDSGTKTYIGNLVKGFAMAVGKMKYGEKAVAFFWSPLAYGSSSSTSYPAYSPMWFYIEIEPKED